MEAHAIGRYPTAKQYRSRVERIAPDAPAEAAPRPAAAPDAPAVESILDRLQRDETRALDELVRRYWRPIVAYAARMLDGLDAAEDVAQEVFLRAWQRRHRWTPRGSESSFLYRIARNLCLNEKRRIAIRSRSAVARAIDVPAPPLATDALEARDLREAAERAIASLPPRRREVFVLARFHQLSYAEIAETMGISERTVANQMSRALASLQEKLREYLD